MVMLPPVRDRAWRLDWDVTTDHSPQLRGGRQKGSKWPPSASSGEIESMAKDPGAVGAVRRVTETSSTVEPCWTTAARSRNVSVSARRGKLSARVDTIRLRFTVPNIA